jgi:hypothetical protein
VALVPSHCSRILSRETDLRGVVAVKDAAGVWATVGARKRSFWRAVRWGPVVFVAALFLLRLPLAAAGLVLAWLAWVASRSVQVEETPCPRCGNPLFRDGMYHNQFASHCLHCRQEIGAPVIGLFPDAQTGVPSPLNAP